MDDSMDNRSNSAVVSTGADDLKRQVGRYRGRGSDRSHRAFDDFALEEVQTEHVGANNSMTNKVPSRSVDGWLVFVKDLNEEVNERDVKDKFIDFGRIVNLHLHINRMTGLPMGTAIVEYANFKDAFTAINFLNGTEWLERTISVGWCFLEVMDKQENKKNQK
uniref:RRM domain-containing protein n=1 Tax=Trichuris muris TaxID=70415 RepID=A0A5S6Q8N8_TRIMR